MPDSVRITNRLSDASPIVIPAVGNLQCSWEINRPGLISFDLPLTDFKALGLPTDDRILAKWLRYVHPVLGTWGGQVTNISGSGGMVILNGESWLSCLNGQMQRSRQSFHGGVQGGPYEWLRSEIEQSFPETGLRAPKANFKGTGTDFNLSMPDPPDGELLGEVVIPAILEYYGYRRTIDDGSPVGQLPRRPDYRNDLRAVGLNVDGATRQASFNSVYGRDLRASVVISHANQIHSSSWSDDLGDHYNAIVAEGSGTVPRDVKPGKKKKIVNFTVRGHGYAESPTHIARFGKRVLTIFKPENPYGGAEPPLTYLTTFARERLPWYLHNRQQVSLDVPNVNDIWSKFREGDLIGVSLPLDGVTGKMVARVRAYNSVGGMLTVGGEAEVV